MILLPSRANKITIRASWSLTYLTCSHQSLTLTPSTSRLEDEADPSQAVRNSTVRLMRLDCPRVCPVLPLSLRPGGSSCCVCAGTALADAGYCHFAARHRGSTPRLTPRLTDSSDCPVPILKIVLQDWPAEHHPAPSGAFEDKSLSPVAEQGSSQYSAAARYSWKRQTRLMLAIGISRDARP
jgi:hypothetical protein